MRIINNQGWHHRGAGRLLPPYHLQKKGREDEKGEEENGRKRKRKEKKKGEEMKA